MKNGRNSEMLRVYFGHHKAATSWVIKIISDLAYLNAFSLEVLNTSKECTPEIVSGLRAGNVNILALRNADPNCLSSLGQYRGFHIVRDPRDIVVSSYFSHRKTHPTENWPELRTHKQKLQAMSIEDGILCDMEFCEKLTTLGFDVKPFGSMAEWDYENDDVMELRYEDIVTSPYDNFIEIFQFLEMFDEVEIGLKSLSKHVLRILKGNILKGYSGNTVRINSWNLLASIYENRFAKKAGGRVRGEENTSSHYRKGIAGDWRNYFTDRHKARFKELYGDIVVNLGYEEKNIW